MFNIAFHGNVSIGEANDFHKNSPVHASFALFPYGFFVDPILGQRMETNGERYRPIVISGKYYFTEYVPTLPKVYFTIEPKHETNEDVEVEFEEENPIVKQLSTIINTQIIEDCENNQEIIDTVNDKLQKNINNIISNNDVTDIQKFLNSPYAINIVDNNVIILNVKDLPKISGKEVSFEIEENDKYIIIDGLKHKIVIDNGIPTFIAVGNSINNTLSLQAVYDNLNSIYPDTI
jgi:hypothetical protein